MDKLTAKQIAEILGKSRQAIVKRAKRERWEYEEVKEGKGSPTKFYLVNSLPEDIKSELKKCNQLTLSNATSTNATNESVNQDELTLNQSATSKVLTEVLTDSATTQTLDIPSFKSATNTKSATESVNLTNATFENIENKALENATKNATTKIKNATSEKNATSTNATNESVNQDELTLNQSATSKSVNQCNQNGTTKPDYMDWIYEEEENETEVTDFNHMEDEDLAIENVSSTEYKAIPEWITLTELSKILKLSKPHLTKRAKKENWEYRITTGKGGKIKQFKTENLPVDIFKKLLAKLTDNIEIPDEFIPRYSTATLEELKEYIQAYNSAKEEHKKEAEAKLQILKAYQTFRSRNKDLTELNAKKEFIKAFNKGRITIALAVEVEINKLNLGTFYRWIELYEKYGLYGLLPKHRGKGRKQKISKEIEQIVLVILDKGITRGKRIYEILQDYKRKGVITGELPAYQTFMRWYKNFQKEKEALITSILAPDKFRSKYQPAIVSSKEFFKADYYGKILMLDSTRADVMCKWEEVNEYGETITKQKRLILTALIDVYSRDVRVAVAERENSEIVANNLFRKWFIEVGIPEKIITDNGKVYRSKHFQQITERLGIEIYYTEAYQPQQKAVVERFFGTIATQLFEVLPGYIGHSVAERKDIESRKKWAKKILKTGEVIEVYLSPEELIQKIEEWLEKRYRKEKHTFGIVEKLILNSPKKPAKITDERIYDVLLGREYKRNLSNQGIRLNNRIYISEELINFYLNKGKNAVVIVREDITDKNRVYVFDEKGNFICEAFSKEGSLDLALEISSKSKKTYKKFIKETRKGMKQAKEKLEKKVELDIYNSTLEGWKAEEDKEKESKIIKFDPRVSEEHKTEETEKAKEILKERKDKVEALKEKKEKKLYISEFDRAWDIVQKIKSGELIDQEDYEFLVSYSQTEEYQKNVDYGIFEPFEELKLSIKIA